MLVVVTVLLGILVLRPIVQPEPVRAHLVPMLSIAIAAACRCHASVRSKRWAIISTISLPISSEAVAAGDGTLHT